MPDCGPCGVRFAVSDSGARFSVPDSGVQSEVCCA